MSTVFWGGGQKTFVFNIDDSCLYYHSAALRLSREIWKSWHRIPTRCRFPLRSHDQESMWERGNGRPPLGLRIEAPSEAWLPAAPSANPQSQLQPDCDYNYNQALILKLRFLSDLIGSRLKGTTTESSIVLLAYPIALLFEMKTALLWWQTEAQTGLGLQVLWSSI